MGVSRCYSDIGWEAGIRAESFRAKARNAMPWRRGRPANERTRVSELAGKQGFEPRYRGPESGVGILVGFGPLRLFRFSRPPLRWASVRFGALPCSGSQSVSLSSSVALTASPSSLTTGAVLRSRHFRGDISEKVSIAPTDRTLVCAEARDPLCQRSSFSIRHLVQQANDPG